MKIPKKQMKACFRLYQILMGLSSWDLTVNFTTSKKVYGTCMAEPEYMKATITLSLAKIRTLGHLKATVIHELMHVVLSPMTHDAQYLVKGKKLSKLLIRREEALITRLEKWPLWSSK